MPIQLLPNARARYSDGTGKPLSQGTVGVYVAGTSFGTLATIWDTVTKDTELTNPKTLDDAGEIEIWYDVEVDVQIKDSTGTVVDTYLGLNPNASAAVTTSFNRIQNGSFEVDSTSDGQPDSWTIGAYTGSAIAITNSVVTDGIAALEFNTGASGSGGGTATSAKFPVTQGSVASVGFSFYATHATTLNTFSINWYDENDALQSTSTVTMPASGSVPTFWTRYQEEIFIDAAGTQGEIVLTGIASGGSNLSSKAYFDGISILNNINIVTRKGVQTLTNKTLTSPVIDEIHDSNDNEILVLTPNASAVNHVAITNKPTGFSPNILPVGVDPDINLVLGGKGTGGVVIDDIRTKTIDIGDWDMSNATGSSTKTVAHNIDHTKIRSISAMIRNDADARYDDFSTVVDPSITGSKAMWADSVNINLFRQTGGSFDGTGWDSTSFNRGWITIKYAV